MGIQDAVFCPKKMPTTTPLNFLDNIRPLFSYYKSLGEQAMAQVPDAALFHTTGDSQNSIATIVKHLHGNMLSRWTNFLTEDGEKPWRDREGEFHPTFANRTEVMQAWEEGWACLFEAIGLLKPEQLQDLIYIRNEGHTVLEALQRQLAHYSYHCGQIVLLSKQSTGEEWQSLSIAKGETQAYNEKRFAQPKKRKRFYE
jgi:hypothetical protein